MSLQSNSDFSLLGLQPYFPLVGVVLGALFAFVSQAFFFSRRSRSDARRSAALIAQDFDFFAEACNEAISSNQLFNDSDGAAGSRVLKMPEMPPIHVDADLKDLRPNTLSNVLSMRLKRDLADRKIVFWWDVVADQDCMQTECVHQCGLVGFEAVKLARKLRSEARLPHPDYSTLHWNFEQLLEETSAIAQEAKRREQEE